MFRHHIITRFLSFQLLLGSKQTVLCGHNNKNRLCVVWLCVVTQFHFCYDSSSTIISFDCFSNFAWFVFMGKICTSRVIISFLGFLWQKYYQIVEGGRFNLKKIRTWLNSSILWNWAIELEWTTFNFHFSPVFDFRLTSTLSSKYERKTRKNEKNFQLNCRWLFYYILWKPGIFHLNWL